MIAPANARRSWLSLFVRRGRPVDSSPAEVHDDLRREYFTRLIASGCAGEAGAQGLMALFPRDF